MNDLPAEILHEIEKYCVNSDDQDTNENRLVCKHWDLIGHLYRCVSIIQSFNQTSLDL